MLAKNPSQWDEQLEPGGQLTAHLPGRDKKEREDINLWKSWLKIHNSGKLT